jgi:AraC-like DNA-binding protein
VLTGMTAPSKGRSTDAVTAASGSGLSSPHLLGDKMLDARVRKILTLIGSGKTLSIRDLALEFNLSPSHLQRLFKKQTGLAMGKWLSEKRLQTAAHLLANSYMSVKEIAHSVGYEHVSSFVRAFERRFARTPLRYRKQSDGTNC